MTNEQHIVESCGAEYLGVEDGLVFFNEPQTHTTLAVCLADITEQAVRRRMTETVKAFERVHKEIQRSETLSRE